MQRIGRIMCLILSFSALVIPGCATAKKTLPAREPRDYSVSRDDARRLDGVVESMNVRADELEEQEAQKMAREEEKIQGQTKELLESVPRGGK